MQAIQTKYLPPTNTKPGRIKAFCASGSHTTSIHSGKMIQDVRSYDVENHRVAAEELIKKFVKRDLEQNQTPPANNPWNRKFVSGQIKNGNYVHVYLG